MGEAVIFSVLTILAFFGIHKLVEMVQSLFTLHLKSTVVVMYKAQGAEDDIELTVRELARFSRNSAAPHRTAVYIVNDDMDTDTLAVCKQTAEQFSNVFVGGFVEAQDLFSEIKEKTA